MRAVLISAALLSACAVGPDYERPAFDLPNAYLTTLSLDEVQEVGLWWQGFKDPAMGALIETALSQNLNLEVAEARFAAAEQGIRSAKSDFLPTLDGFGSGQIRAPLDEPTQKSTSNGARATLILDINGRLRRQLEQARALSAQAGFTAQNARRLVASGVAANYIEASRTAARLVLLDESLDLQNQTLDIVKARRRAGLSADLDVERAAADLARTRAQRGLLALSQAQAQFALALLLGETPADRQSDFAAISDAAQVPRFEGAGAIGLPKDLLRQRPDVLAAEADLMAASAGIGIAKSALFPALRLPGNFTYTAGDGVFAFSDAAALISATLDIPLLDAGRRVAQVRAARATARAALATYELALLQGVQDVETALVAVASFEARRTDLASAVRSSEAAFDQLNALYKEGLATFIDILDAQRTLITSREAFVDVEADLSAAYVNLYTAIGAPTSLPPVQMTEAN
ncbi:MAG: efflux transporter outer membrane subunit [Sphingomonadales bacterium]